MLLALSAIDLETMLLPDVLVFPLLPAGLLFQALYGDGILAAVAGGATAFAAMWAIGAAYKQARGQDGLGGGDVKLAGALGAWIGIAHVLIFLTSAFGVALMVMGPLLLVSRAQAAKPLPFGPFLALSASVLVLCPLVGTIFDRLIGG
jgi:prepilin signal peptidase PulO-like enzyme (type II secretory pathway)